MKKKNRICIGIIIFSIIVTCISLNFMPDKIPVHYNGVGEIDRWGSKLEMFIFPIIMIIFNLIMYLSARYYSKHETLGENPDKLMSLNILLLLMFHMFELIFIYLTMKNIDGAMTSGTLSTYMLSFISIVLIITGFFLPRCKKNSFIGMRTVWSMKNDNVWKKCQVFGGRSLIICGILNLISMVVMPSDYRAFTFLLLILISTMIDVIASYVYAKKY